MNLVSTLRDRAAEHPERCALADVRRGRTRRMGYGELWRSVGGAARALRAGGLRTGDRILVCHPVTIECYVLLLGAMQAGLVCVFADPGAGPVFLEACGRRLPAAAFFGSTAAQWLRWRHAAWRQIPLAWTTGRFWPDARVFRPAPAVVEAEDVADDHPALVTFTSGSTGLPKATVRTHGFLLAQHRALAEAIHLRPGEVDLVTLPVFTLANLASGLTSVLADADLRRPGQVDPGRIAAQCATEGVTRCAASPAFFRCLLAGKTFPAFEAVHIGGAPVFPSLLEALRAARPAMRVQAVYGSSEAEPVAELDAASLGPGQIALSRTGHGLPAGRPCASIRLAVIRDQWGTPIPPLDGSAFRAMECGPNEAGEIVVSGAHVLPGYLDGVGDAETKFHAEGRTWHRTGDAGHLDESGRLWLRGRCAATIRTPTGTLRPLEVEARLDGVPGVRRSALIEEAGQVALAVEGDAEAARMVLRGLPIDVVLEVDSIPVDRRHQAKTDYPALRKLVAKRLTETN